jgi:hypothetical protein
MEALARFQKALTVVPEPERTQFERVAMALLEVDGLFPEWVGWAEEGPAEPHWTLRWPCGTGPGSDAWRPGDLGIAYRAVQRAFDAEERDAH